MDRRGATEGLTSAEVAMMTGMTYRQIDHALRNYTGIIKDATPGSGRHRSWMPFEVARMFAYAALQKAGVSADLIQECLYMTGDVGDKDFYLMITDHGVCKVHSHSVLINTEFRWVTVIPITWRKWIRMAENG